LPDQTEALWRKLEDRLGHRFADRELLAAALTHRSFANEFRERALSDNERLEFLGDAVLDLAVGHALFAAHQAGDEGELSRLRAELVSATSLARRARALQLGGCLRLGRGEERSGGRSKESLLADTLEALIGAVFIDAGYAAAAGVVATIFQGDWQSAASLPSHDYKTRLQELLQARQLPLPEYQLTKVLGPDHQRLYQVEVLIDGAVAGLGAGPTKKRAEQDAARLALASLAPAAGGDDV
jgi:ribonuclease-3